MEVLQGFRHFGTRISAATGGRRRRAVGGGLALVLVAGVLTAAPALAAAPDPDPPIGVTAVATGNTSATVSWTAPTFDGGTPITGYQISAQPGQAKARVDSAATSGLIEGLTTGLTYTFTVRAINQGGYTSLPSAKSNEVVAGGGPAATAPGAPTNVTAVAGDGTATVTWTPPADDGGATITGYRINSQPGKNHESPGSNDTSWTFPGLTGGVSYTFTVMAVNSVGMSVASTPSNPVVPRPAPATVSDAPTNVTAVAGDSSATVSWTPPANSGGSAITGYEVTTSPGGKVQAMGSVTSTRITGLTNGTGYSFTVVALNGVGRSPASARSNTVTPTATPGTVERWAGPDRYASSATFSAKSFQPGVGVAYVASGLNFPDALSGAPVAGMNGGPVLLTNPQALPVPIVAELKRLQPKRIVVLGGTGAVGAAVQRALDAYTTGPVERWAGSDRYASSAAFSAKSFPVGVSVAYVASGMNFPDALSGAPVAGKTPGPVLLTGTTSLPGSIATELRRLQPKKIVVLGGIGVVSDTVRGALGAYTNGTVDRWAGSDRYASSAAISSKGYASGVGVAYIASGLNFPDALSGGPIAGKTRGPVLLTSPNSLPGSVATELKRLRPKKIVVLGGTAVVSETVQNQLKAYLG
jgi:putative cell wall-binding protein